MRTAVLLCLVTGCAAAPPPLPPPPPGQPPSFTIVQTGAPVLRQRARELRSEEIGTPEFRALVDKMVATMRAAPGVGLAAPQIGVGLRVIVLEDRPELEAKSTPLELEERERAPFPLRVIVNPELRTVGDAKALFFEGCLSVAGFAGMVDRALEVEVTGRSERDEPVTWQVRGWPARILQHEVDHLNGTLYIDRMLPRSFSTLDQAKARFGGKPIAEVRALLGL